MTADNLPSAIQGYLATPPPGGGPGVLVLHPWWGLSDAVKQACDRLAAHGFIAYAPDLYHGHLAATIEQAETLAQQLNPANAMADITAAVELLWERAGAPERGLGVIGFSLGAFYALRLSAADPQRISAVVLFYGTGDGEFSRARATYLGHFAETDPYEPVESVEWVQSALTTAGRSATFYRYQGVGHWFAEADRPQAYNEAAANLAWQRTLAFLKSALDATSMDYD